MSPMVNRIAFKFFRGLPNLEIPFKRNLLIYAGNGRGKSSIVQGLEWLFSGEVENIDNTAIRHINAKEKALFALVIDE